MPATVTDCPPITPPVTTSTVPVTETPSPVGLRTVLKNRAFLTLWLGQVFSQLADRIIFVVFIALITAYFGNNDRHNDYLYIAFTIPAILLTAIAGVFVDRWSRRAVLVITNLLRAGLVALLPLAIHGPLMGVYTVAFLLSAVTQFFVPAEAATIPAIVPKSQLMAANSLFTTTMMASVIFGFALGDPLISVMGLEHVHWPLMGLFLLSAVALATLRIPGRSATQLDPVLITTHGPASPSPHSLKDRVDDVVEGALAETADAVSIVRGAWASFWGELAEGITYMRERPLIVQAMLKLALLFSVMVVLCILFITFAKRFLYDDPQVAARKFAYIITMSGVGMGLGAVLVGKFGHHIRRSLLVFAGFAGMGACLLALAQIAQVSPTAIGLRIPSVRLLGLTTPDLAFSARLVFTYSCTFLMGIGAAMVAIPLQALLHDIIPEDKRGKILGVQFTLLSTASTFPVLLAGVGVGALGVPGFLQALALPLALVGGVGLITSLWRRHALTEDW